MSRKNSSGYDHQENGGEFQFQDGQRDMSPTRRPSSPTKELKDHNLMQKIIENEGDYKKSSLFASSIVQIRNNIYYIISRCI